MKIAFPYMGNSPHVFRLLLNDLGHTPVVPPPPSERTLSLGTKYAPEFACLPFKILLGSYIEALEMGADTIVTSGGVGPCRAGYYGELHRRILTDMGYQFEMIVLEPPLKDIGDFVRKIVRLKGKNTWREFFHALRPAWQLMKAVDEVEALSHKLRPREKVKGSISAAYKRAINTLSQAQTIGQVEEARQAAIAELMAVPRDDSVKPLRVGIVGEIYVVLEPFSNHHVEETLGHLGVEVHRSIFLAQWFLNNGLYNREFDVKKAASPYLPELIGGHGRNSLGETVRYAKEGFDGVVQLAPFTCIPEIVAKSIMPAVSRDHHIPVLTLFLDEQTGEAGQETRLEAFVDLLWRKRESRKEGTTWKVSSASM